MKKYSSVVLFLAIILTFGISSGAWAATISWDNPTTYTDATPISAGAQATLTTKIYYATTSAGCATGTLFQTVLSGAELWTGAALPVTAKGSTTYYCATSTIPAEGQEGAKGPAVSYTVPFVAPSAPVIINIAK
jgi:hypothetical protein